MAETLAARDDGKKFTVWHDGKKEELDGVLDYLIRRDGPDRERWSLTPPPPSAVVEAWFDGTKLPPPEAPPPTAAGGAAPVTAPVAPPPPKPEISKHTISRLEWDTIRRGPEAELWTLEAPEGYAAQEEAKAKAKEPKPHEPKASTSAEPHEMKPGAPVPGHAAPPPPHAPAPPPGPARGHR
jgi:hypothetical protein